MQRKQDLDLGWALGSRLVGHGGRLRDLAAQPSLMTDLEAEASGRGDCSATYVLPDLGVPTSLSLHGQHGRDRQSPAQIKPHAAVPSGSSELPQPEEREWMSQAEPLFTHP